MNYKLGKNVKEGQRIKTKHGWRKIKNVTISGVILTDDFVEFGEVIYGWKSK